MKRLLCIAAGLGLMSSTALAQVAAPSALAATAISDTAIRLNWTDNSSNESGFNIYRATQQGGAFLKIATVAANVTQFDDTGLPASTTRHYRVLAIKNSSVVVTPEELSDVSAGVAATTMSPNQPPVAVADTNQGVVPPPVTLTGNVLTNDSDPNSDPLTVQQPNANIAADGSYSIMFDASGVFSFPYTVLDGRGGSATSELVVTIEQANNPPVAVDDFVTGQTNQAITGNVLVNDTDTDGDLLTVVQPNADIDSGGNFSKTYATVPSPNPVVINYTVQDGQGGTDQGELRITVNAPPPPPGDIIAFPGADGVGRFAKGGRGGSVIKVTNLNASGTGSLKACVDASGPRTCTFNGVSGYINMGSTGIHVNNPFLTIAGETSPNGIALRNTSSSTEAPMRIHTHDVVIRHMKFRPGNPPHNSVGTPNGDGLATGQIGQLPVYNVMIDHSTFSWATDENIDHSPVTEITGSGSPVDRVTVQNSMVYEGLKPHSKGPNLRSCGISMVKNLIASNTIRNPNNTCGKWSASSVRGGGGITGETEFRNNVVYNGTEGFFDMWDGRGEGWANIVGNVFIKGPNSLQKLGTLSHDIYPIDAWNFGNRTTPSGTCQQNGNMPGCASDADPLHIYVNDNIALSGAGKNWPTNGVGGGMVNPNDAHLLSATVVGDGVGEDGLTGTAMPASQVLASVLANAGAYPNNRDAADAAIVTNVNNRTGNIPTCTTSSTAPSCNTLPYPTIAMGSSYPDADNDGMDDTWEPNVGGTSATANGDHDSDGWTNLEEFLHFLAAIR